MNPDDFDNREFGRDMFKLLAFVLSIWFFYHVLS